MSGIEPSPKNTLVILLGASEWQPRANLMSSPAFACSASKVKDYFSQPHLFGLPPENFLDLFDQKQNAPFFVYEAISDFLEERIERMKQEGAPARDLFFYYIGHGVFAGSHEEEYHLAIRCTNEIVKASAIEMGTLADTIKKKARDLRRLVILDCCFSADAFRYFQSGPDQAAVRQTAAAFEVMSAGSENLWPKKGTALLCSSSKDSISSLLHDFSGTMFSEALVRVLSTGNERQSKKKRISLYDLRDAIQVVLEDLAGKGAPRSHIASPDQSDGDVAALPLFPNFAAPKESGITLPPAALYRQKVQEAWNHERLDNTKIAQLTTLAESLNLHQEQVALIERGVMEDTKEAIWARQVAHERQEQYRREVEISWANRRLSEAQIMRLKDLATKLGLSQEQVATIERTVMEETKEVIWARQVAREYQEQYRREVEKAWDTGKLSKESVAHLIGLVSRLDLSGEDVATIERAVMKETKEVIWARQSRPSVQRTQASPNFALIHTLSGHSGTLFSVAFSPDGYMLASCSRDRSINVWNPRTGELLRTLTGHSSSITSVAFSPTNGQLLASGSADHTIKVWNLRTAKRSRTLLGHSDAVLSVAFSPDGQLLASGSADGTIKAWDPHTGQLLHTIETPSFTFRKQTPSINSVAFSPDGQLLASGSADGTIQLWDPHTGQFMHRLAEVSFAALTAEILSVMFNPQDHLLASCSRNHTIKVWKPRTNELLLTLDSSSSHPLSVAFSLDGQLLASGSADGTIQVWSSYTGELLDRLVVNSSSVFSIAFDPDGLYLASGGDDQAVRVWKRRI